MSELDDFNDEKSEIIKDQGPAFPYTKGMWLVSHLVAPINPDDLDAIDESIPFSKFTLDSLLGRVHSQNEYQYYFDRNPHSTFYRKHFHRLANESATAKAIIPPNQRQKHDAGSNQTSEACVCS